MIDSGRDNYDSEYLELLADFRDSMKMERDHFENRVQGRNRRGRTLVKRDGSVGTGPYTMEYRKILLDRLKVMQNKIGKILITDDEESKIKQIWAEESADLTLLLSKKLRGENDGNR